MNIDDVKAEAIQIPQSYEIFPQIFAHQRALAIKYGPIEERNGFYHPDFNHPPHIDNAKFQHWIKDMFWRTTEEIAEAFESYDHHLCADWRLNWDKEASVRHFFEELADALHFFVEVSILSGLEPHYVNDLWNSDPPDESWSARNYAREFIFTIGLAANCLKNKPWKNSHMPTDEHKFRTRIYEAWHRFMMMWRNFGWTKEEVYTIYMKKHTVNSFRQATNY